MLHEPAAPEPSLSSRFPPEKIVATALVALLHIAVVWLLLRATLVRIVPPALLREAPITLWLQSAPQKVKPPEPKPEKEPKKEAAPAVKKAVGPILPAPPVSAQPPAADYNGLRAFGRYLNNCSNLSYEDLSQRELAHCLGNQWGKPGEAPVTLGLQPPSEWKAQMDERKKPARKIEHECAQGSLNSNLGLPCYSLAN